MLEGVAALLRGCQPELVIESLEYLGEGDFCRAYLLNRYLVVRIPKHEGASRALVREACLLPKIAPHLPMSVPTPTLVSCPAAGGLSLSIHEQVRGSVLTRELWGGFEPTVRTRLAHEVGHFLRGLHALDPGLGRACGLEFIGRGEQVEVDPEAEVEPQLGVEINAEVGVRKAAGLDAPLERRLEMLCQHLREAPGAALPSSLRKFLEDFFARSLAGGAEWTYEPVLLHGDLSPEHLLVDAVRGEITGVIDWGDVAIGNPARDFIYFYDWGPDFLALSLETYGFDEGLWGRAHLYYLAEYLEWTLGAAEEGRTEDLREGITALLDGMRGVEGGQQV